MPQVDGLDLLRFVRSHEQLMDLPVVSECSFCTCVPNHPVIRSAASLAVGGLPMRLCSFGDEGIVLPIPADTHIQSCEHARLRHCCKHMSQLICVQ